MEDHILYHYTTTDVLLKVIKNGELWLSDIRYMNDTKEGMFVFDLIVSALAEIDLEPFRARLRCLDRADELLSEFEMRLAKFRNGHVGSAFDVKEPYMIYAACMSEDGDSLAQWRAYGNGEICIGFRTNGLLENIRTMNTIRHVYGDTLFLGKVQYESDLKPPLRLVSRLAKMLDVGIGAVEQKSCRTLGDLYTYDAGNSPDASLSPVFLKHAGFHSEEEWRLVVFDMPPDHVEPWSNLRAAGPHLVPFRALKFDAREFIARIVFGPGSDPMIVKHFKRIATTKLLPNCEIDRSVIPYRK